MVSVGQRKTTKAENVHSNKLDKIFVAKLLMRFFSPSAAATKFSIVIYKYTQIIA